MNGQGQEVPLSLNINNTQMKSLQNSRNTKKLSLSINLTENNINNGNANFVTNTNADTSNVIPTTISRSPTPTLSTQGVVRKPSLLSKRSEASIYSNNISKPSELSPSTLKFASTNSNSATTTAVTPPSYRTHPITSRDNHIPMGLSRNHSLSLSVNTQIPRTHSRNRSKTIDTSTPLPKGPSTIKTTLPLNSQFIPSQYNDSASNGKTTWVFPETNGDMHSDMNNNNSNNMYEEVYTKDAYPNGPLLVIPPNIYLYSEPKLDEILDFDLIINVAEEMPNLQYLIPAKFHGKIQYYHVEWSHRSKIVKDLRRLTEIMHNATLQNKKLLIHCQCGVSRSASLMVAYIMRYCNMNLNDAYNKLKSIAKDISPNMGLIFQLMEWNEELTMLTNDVTQGDNEAVDPCDMEGDDKNGNDSSTNDSSLNTSSDLTPRTPFDFNKGSDFTTLNT